MSVELKSSTMALELGCNKVRNGLEFHKVYKNLKHELSDPSSLLYLKEFRNVKSNVLIFTQWLTTLAEIKE